MIKGQGQRETVAVRDADELRAMTPEYRELLVRDLTAYVKRERAVADEYALRFYPLTTDTFEKRVCCDYAGDLMRHHMHGVQVLNEMGAELAVGPNGEVSPAPPKETPGAWVGRGVFGWVMGTARLALTQELAASSYGPVAEICLQAVEDKKRHAVHGHGIVHEACKSEDGQRRAQEALDWIWPAVLRQFEPVDAAAEPYLRWRLWQHSRDQVRASFVRSVRPKLEELDLRVTDAARSAAPPVP